MSLLIKGMKMPTEGRLMTIYKLQGKFYVSQNCELCPLIELPDHGDLIERDALKDDMDDKRDCETWIGIEECLKCADAAPVVIPAERSVDKDKDVPCKGAERSEE